MVCFVIRSVTKLLVLICRMKFPSIYFITDHFHLTPVLEVLSHLKTVEMESSGESSAKRRKIASANFSWTDLPTEIWLRILEQLSQVSLVHLSRTCHLLHNLCQEQ